MRLSPKGWNNVLIFAVLTIIFIFNFGDRLTLSTHAQQRTVIPNDLTIVEIKTPDFKITRVGRTWKSTPDLGLSDRQLSLLVQNWQTLKLPTQAAIPPPTTPYIISVYTANQEQPITVRLFQQSNNYLLQTDSTMSMLLGEKQLPLLLGR